MPLKTEQYQRSLAQPPLCEQLKVRDLTDSLLIQLSGAFVAGYKVSGINSYYASDDDRNRTKLALEALVRSLPERSMRLQVRFEISEGTGDLIARYNREQQNQSAVLQAVDREQSDAWLKKDAEGYYLQHILHFYFIWDPRIHHQSPDFEWKKKMRGTSLSMSATKCIERSRREHEDLLAEFNSLMSGVEATLRATGMKIERLTHIIEAQADAWLIRANAYTQAATADLMRLRAVDLANSSADIKMGATNTTNLRQALANLLQHQ
jgi:hypothetical protein